LRLLLDTNALLWAADGRLKGDAKRAVEESADEVYVSAASVWEIEIKRALGRLKAPDDVAAMVDESGFKRLSITFEHAVEAGRLPPLHADPFDRVLIAQAKIEALTLGTSDEAIGRYEVETFAIGN
jgi:PIN domain nuclease of toxin-antitoxin system